MAIPKETQEIINYFKGKTGQDIEVKGINRRGTEVYNYTTVHIDYPAYKAYDDMKVVQGEECPNAGYLADYNITSDNGQYDRVVANCMDINDLNDKYQRVVYGKVNAPTQSLPLERKTYSDATDETYKTYWNHHVVCENPDETIVEADWKEKGWDGSTDPETGDVIGLDGYLDIPSGYTPSDSTKPAMWQKTSQGLKTSQKVLLTAKLPGVQSFMYPVKDITQTIYTPSTDVVEEYVTNNGKLYPPRSSSGSFFTFGIGTLDSSNGWLISGVTVDKEYGWYIVRVSYKFADDGWVPELYQYASGLYNGDFDL